MKNNNKIAIVSASLGIGGAERFASLLSFMLHDLGYEVHHIIILDVVNYDFKGTLTNLGKLFGHEKGIIRAVKKGKYIANYLYKNDIQVIIDNRSRPKLLREIFVKWIYGKRKMYFMIHSSNLNLYFSKYANYLYKNATKLVCVSKDIENKIQLKFSFKNTTVIYNPIVFSEVIASKPGEVPDNYILFFGRLEDKIKNFSLLLNAFHLSKIYQTGMRLLIIGDGSGKDFIQDKIATLQLENFVKILPFKKNIIDYVQHAKFTILTSNFEGFPMSIIESLASGVPVISVDCETGPREIIQNQYNGLLVPNYDEKALADAISTMTLDLNLYNICKNNAQKSVEHLGLKIISQQWKQLLEL